jgi:hypothetical protein
MPLPSRRLALCALSLVVASGCSHADDQAAASAVDAGAAAPIGTATGVVLHTTFATPDGLTTACEDPWTVRLLHYHPGPVVPRRMYVASCTPPSGEPRLLVSATLTSSTVVSGKEDAMAGNSGVVFEADWKDGAGLAPNGVARAFPECREMHGIAASPDCSVVGVLCRRATGSSTTASPTKDMVAAIPQKGARDWLTQPTSADGKTSSDEEWLYEWPKGDLAAAPDTYVASKAIGSWEYGSQRLVYGAEDGSFGLSLKSTVYGPDKIKRHEGDALLVVDRASHTIDLARGWTWGCAAGHTIYNHLAHSPTTGRYAVTCGTDLGVDPSNAGGLAGVWLHPEGAKHATGLRSEALWKSLSFGGGPGTLVPTDDGGFLGVIVGAPGGVAPDTNFRASGPTSAIGLVRYDASGAVVGSIRWLAVKDGVFLSYPALASLGGGRYLLGWGEMASLADEQAATAAKKNIDDAFRIPGAYHVQEVDDAGALLGPDQVLDGVGWGEQDEMVPLGDGRVAWAYIPAPARAAGKNPPCLSHAIALDVYVAK